MIRTEITDPDALLAVGVEGALADLLVSRTRTILWIALAVGLTFQALEVVLAPRLSAPFYVKCIGIFMIGATLVVLRRGWVMRHAVVVAVVIVLGGYLLTALSGMLSPSREYETTAVLFAVGALTMATMLPWGLWPQTLTVLFGAVLLCIAVYNDDGNLYVLLQDPAAAVALALGLSILTSPRCASWWRGGGPSWRFALSTRTWSGAWWSARESWRPPTTNCGRCRCGSRPCARKNERASPARSTTSSGRC
jgi:hypothetical protein